LFDGGAGLKFSTKSGLPFSFAKNGTMYLSSDGDNRDNKSFDIFFARLNKGQYSLPEKMEEAITTPFTEQVGDIAPDEGYIVIYRYT
jgi:hypothetical protein